MKYEQKRQAREATKNDYKHDAKQLMTTLDVFEDQDDFIYQNIRNLFMTPE